MQSSFRASGIRMHCALTLSSTPCFLRVLGCRLLQRAPEVSRFSCRSSMRPLGRLSERSGSDLPGCIVAVAQLTSSSNAEENLATCTKLVQEAVVRQCRMMFLPECFAFMGSSSDEALTQAEPLSGRLMQQYCDLARSNKMWLSLGGFHEKSDTGKMFNTHVIVSSDGHIIARYRKIHLFDVDIPGGPCLKESRLTIPGTEVVTCDTPVGRLGLTVCYDLRFPQLYQRLVTEGGAQILLVPSAFTKTTGRAHWHALLRARAIENQAFVIAAAQTGRHNTKRESFGCSLIVSPWGEVLAEIAPEETGIATARIDLNEVLDTQAKMPVQKHKEAASAAVASPIIRHPLTKT